MDSVPQFHRRKGDSVRSRRPRGSGKKSPGDWKLGRRSAERRKAAKRKMKARSYEQDYKFGHLVPNKTERNASEAKEAYYDEYDERVEAERYRRYVEELEAERRRELAPRRYWLNYLPVYPRQHIMRTFSDRLTETDGSGYSVISDGYSTESIRSVEYIHEW